MISLKDYQIRVLDSVRAFMTECSRGRRPDEAFRTIQLQNGGSDLPYFPIQAAGLGSGMPYVCLRVPTGGGKTLLACYTAGIVMDELLNADRAVVLWLVPSSTILNQTVDALKDVRHPYRRALEQTLGAVEVVSIEDALRLSRASVDGSSVVIVATMQSFRVEDTTGRKVYEQNGSFLEHLANIPADRRVDMLTDSRGQPVPSLVNMLRLRRPIVIVDEAHNARTELSFTTLGNVLPSCVIEFTATPARAGTPSNVLHRVSASELKAAEMVKLPLRVITRHPSQRDQLLGDAVALRADLERIALIEGQDTGEYLRPILLIQAERVDACDPLRDRLVSEFGVDRDTIKISVGSLDELKGISDINASTCPVRVIITVQKLREGWDCPFAYVLCSLRETRSATAIEQIVGRILRLPSAKLKRHPDLNSAYAFSLSETLGEVLAELREALESNGFTKAEAERIVIPTQEVLPFRVQPQTLNLSPRDIDAEVAASLVGGVDDSFTIDATTGAITVNAPLNYDQLRKLVSCIRTETATEEVIDFVTKVIGTHAAFGAERQALAATPYELGSDFVVPLLSVEENGELFEFESSLLIEHPWKLSAKDASLPNNYNPLTRAPVRSGVIDVGLRGEVRTSIESESQADFVVQLHQHALELSGSDQWSLDQLVAWLDRHISHQDIPVGESAEFLRKAVRGLMTQYGIADVSTLALDRFRLRDAVEDCINAHRKAERLGAFQRWLLPTSQLVVSPDVSINFKTMTYEPSWLYSGGFQFKRHYFGPRPGELAEQRSDGTLKEEFQCAQFIDGMQKVRFWVRNLAQRRTSFRLQTSEHWFYPDFVCKLEDGRVLVVEYKGAHLFADAEEKRAVGAVWASRSNGGCLFVMPTDADFSVITNAVV